MCNANIFRKLLPDEIEVRVQQVVKISGIIKANLLLYKNARVDMDLLDEHFGCLGWQREHTFKNNRNYCKVSVYDKDHDRWVSKEDVGVESNTEEVKGEASDSFKRACVNLGIGRELYTAPPIFVELSDNEYSENGTDKYGNPKYKCKSWVSFSVSDIEYDDRRSIKSIAILDHYGRVRFPNKPQTQAQPRQAQPTKKTLTLDKIMDETFLKTLCEWLHKNAQGNNLDTFIRNYYDCDIEVMNCITKEYNRLYA